MRRLRLLQIFSKYLEYGGEEYIAGRIEDALADRHEMFRYVGSSRKLFEGGLEVVIADMVDCRGQFMQNQLHP